MHIRTRFISWLGRLSKDRSRQGLYEFLGQEYRAIPAHAEVLSIGAGGDVNKLLLAVARERDFKVTTFDIDVQRGPDIVGDICTHDFGPRRFDVIVMSEVLEHLVTPPLGLNTVYRALKPNGRLVLSTPFILPMHDRPYDFFRYTRYGLEMLLREFREVRVQERNSYFEAIDVLWMRLLVENARNSRAVSAFLLPLVFFIKRPFTLLLGRLVKVDGMTTGYVVTAVK